MIWIVGSVVFALLVFVLYTLRRLLRRIVRLTQYCDKQRCKLKYVDNSGVYLTLPSEKVVGPFKTIGELEKFAKDYLNYELKK